MGFGISTPEQARAAAEHADGVVVASALMRLRLDGAGARGPRRGPWPSSAPPSTPDSGRQVEVPVEERERAVPGQRGRLGVVLGAVGLEEPVAGAGVAVERGVEAEEVQVGLEEHEPVLVDVRVVLGVVAEVRGAGVGEVDVLPAVERGRWRRRRRAPGPTATAPSTRPSRSRATPDRARRAWRAGPAGSGGSTG